VYWFESWCDLQYGINALFLVKNPAVQACDPNVMAGVFLLMFTGNAPVAGNTLVICASKLWTMWNVGSAWLKSAATHLTLVLLAPIIVSINIVEHAGWMMLGIIGSVLHLIIVLSARLLSENLAALMAHMVALEHNLYRSTSLHKMNFGYVRMVAAANNLP
jgi:hypothetical protein